MIKRIRNCILIIIGGALIGAILLTIAFLLPLNEKNIAESNLIIEKEGWYPAVPVFSQSFDTHFQSLLPGVLDNSTDRLMLQTASEDSEGNALYRAMNMYSSSTRKGYSYYWHGYISVLKPLLLFFDYGEIRIINSFLQILLIMVLGHKIWKKKGFVYVLVLLSAYMMLMPPAVNFSMQFSWVFYIGMFGCLILLKNIKYFEENKRIFYVFLILGVLTSYFDLLTYPLYTWAFPLIWWIIMSPDDIASKKRLKTVIDTGLFWIFGYGGMWFLKWVLGSLVLKENIFESAINQIFHHSSVNDGNILLSGLQAININWKHYTYKIYILIIVAWLMWFFIQSFSKGWKTDSRITSLGLIAISPIVWYMALSTHTSGHHFFTYRVFDISILAVLSIWVVGLAQPRERKLIIEGKRIVGIISIWIILAVCAGAISMTMKDEEFIMNGYHANRPVLIPQNSLVEMEFIPSFSIIKEINFCLETDDVYGTYEFSLYKDGNLLDQASVLVKDLEGSRYFAIPVKWKLKKLDTYQIQIKAQTDQDTYILVTEPQEPYMVEYNNLTVNGEQIEGSPISGITYMRRPVLNRMIFWEITWLCVLIAIFVVVSNCFKPIRNKIKMFHSNT